MAIFGIVKESTMTNEFEGQFNFTGSETELGTISMEAASDIYKIQAGMFVSDIMMESAIMEGASEEVLLEGFAKDIFDKLIETFKKLWAKIKEWFNKAIRAIQILFMSGEKFVKKFENEITSKDTTGYSYKGYKWNKGPVAKLYELKDYEKAEVAATTSIEAAITDLLGTEFKEEKVTGEHVTKFKEEFFKKLANVDNLSEMKSEAIEKATGGEKEEIENFEVYSISEMISHIKDSKKTIAKLNKAQVNIKKDCDNAIKSLENFRKSLSTEEKAKHSTTVTNLASIYRFLVSVSLAGVETATTVNKMQQREFEGALKGLLRYKGTKEGFNYDSSKGSTSILEAAMKMI